MSLSRPTKAENESRAIQIAELRAKLKPGTTVYTVLRHVSSSGMTRHISVMIMEDGQPRQIDWSVSVILRDRLAKREGIIVGGCGMDMGFHLVYSLGRALYPEGFKLPEGTRGRNGDTSGHDRDGGYAFNHRWL